MGVSVTRNFGPLTETALLTQSDWERVGRLAREAIVLRTRRGDDRHGVPFRPYSAGYAQAKAKELGAGPVNLTLSGQMLNAITIEADDHGVTLSFNR